jgi:hypothetical protein
MPRTSRVDVVVHLHGYSGRGAGMSLTRDKLPVSGLDFTDPADPSSAGRRHPTLLVLPRGNFFHGRSGAGYDFPALLVPGALDRLVDDALARFGAAAGLQAARGRLILTAHSGGGAALMRILRHTDPDEVHAFDALYGDPAPLIAWARRRRGRADSALRVVFRAGEDTARASGAVAAALAGAGPAFRVEATRVAHGEIPRRFGWRLLADAAADLPGVTAGGAAPRRPAPSPTGPGAGSPRPAPSGGGPRLSTAALRQAWAEYRCAGNRMVPLQLLSHRTPVNPVAVDAFRALGTALAAAGYVRRPHVGLQLPGHRLDGRQPPGAGVPARVRPRGRRRPAVEPAPAQRVGTDPFLSLRRPSRVASRTSGPGRRGRSSPRSRSRRSKPCAPSTGCRCSPGVVGGPARTTRCTSRSP